MASLDTRLSQLEAGPSTSGFGPKRFALSQNSGPSGPKKRQHCTHNPPVAGRKREWAGDSSDEDDETDMAGFFNSFTSSHKAHGRTAAKSADTENDDIDEVDADEDDGDDDDDDDDWLDAMDDDENPNFGPPVTAKLADMATKAYVIRSNFLKATS